jgi:hypothetical protein
LPPVLLTHDTGVKVVTGIVATGGKFAADVVDTGGKSDAAVIDTSGYGCRLSLIPLVQQDWQISPRIFEKI